MMILESKKEIPNTPIKIFDKTKKKHPNLINPGDIVTFKKISLNDYKNYDQ